MKFPHQLLSFVALAVVSSSLLSGCALKQTAAAAEPKVEYMKLEDDYTPTEVEATQVPMPYFVLDGKPFCFEGTNNYYLTYKSEEAVLDVLEAAAEMNLSVMRTWGFLDRGSLDGSVRNIREPGHKDGIYFQYWDVEKKRPAYNDGPDGLQKLDFILHHARRLNLKLIIALTNSWRDFGGMDQYLVWYGLDKHHEFYTDERVKQAYKDWVAHLLNRKNSIDGTLYREDTAVFAWELANEPRTKINEDFDADEGWDPTTITKWADEMSAYVKSLDQNHMVAVGDEGFFNGGANHWTYEAEGGVDHVSLTALPNVDFGTYHLYPDHWGTGHRWGMEWIETHIEAARKLGKPTILEEYGIHVKRAQEISGPVTHGWERREVAYKNYNNVTMQRGGAGALFWILSGIEKGEELYPDYDHFTVYRGDKSAQLISTYAKRFSEEARACVLAKRADHGPASPFVQARPAPGSQSGGPKGNGPGDVN
jgi:mannan endo-1,4-beta-mannosidase